MPESRRQASSFFGRGLDNKDARSTWESLFAGASGLMREGAARRKLSRELGELQLFALTYFEQLIPGARVDLHISAAARLTGAMHTCDLGPKVPAKTPH